MPETRNVSEQLQESLAVLRRQTHCRWVAVASHDGLPIASLVTVTGPSLLPAATAASILGSAEVAARELESGYVEQILIRCNEGNIAVMHAGPAAVLIAAYPREENVGLALLGMSRASMEVAEILEHL